MGLLAPLVVPRIIAPVPLCVAISSIEPIGDGDLAEQGVHCPLRRGSVVRRPGIGVDLDAGQGNR